MLLCKSSLSAAGIAFEQMCIQRTTHICQLTSTWRQHYISPEASFVAGMVNWATSRDPILQRYGVGGVARAAVSSAEGLAAVMHAEGLKALVSAVSEDDPQAQCFAAAALGRHSSCVSFGCTS